MAELSVKIKTNWIGSALGLNTVRSTDGKKGDWGTRLDRLLNWVSQADCSGQLTPDTGLSFSSATAGATPLLN
jgi:hypothetical protein